MKELPKIGDIEPTFQQIGWKVCKKSAEKEEEQEWIPVEKYYEAEVLSDLYKRQ